MRVVVVQPPIGLVVASPPPGFSVMAFGGVCGIALGTGAAAAGACILGAPFIINPGVIIAAFLFSGAVGVIFGYFPARQAARMDPINALRHE